MSISAETLNRHAPDVFFGSVVFSAVMGWLPALTSIAALVWYGMQMYDWVKKKLNARRNHTRRAGDPSKDG